MALKPDPSLNPNLVSSSPNDQSGPDLSWSLKKFNRISYFYSRLRRVPTDDVEDLLDVMEPVQPEFPAFMKGVANGDIEHIDPEKVPAISDEAISAVQPWLREHLHTPLAPEDKKFVISQVIAAWDDDALREECRRIVSDGPDKADLPAEKSRAPKVLYNLKHDETFVELQQWWNSVSKGFDSPTFPVVFERDGQIFQVDIPYSTTVSDTSQVFANLFHVPEENQKLQMGPPLKILRAPFHEDFLCGIPSASKAGSKIKLIGSSTKDIDAMNREIQRRAYSSAVQLRGGGVGAWRRRDWRQVQEEATYTFHDIRPLPYLPKPERSARFLARLRDDPGIKAAMRKHRFSVPLLTEMNPAEHTTHESKTLGLNRNKGEVIELRLRTDAYDGYRDYKVIRKTLCHELAHCVHSEHDRHFWDLTKQIEGEVERADWKHGGHRLTEQEFYNPNDTGEPDEHLDHGGWTGGNFVLGGTAGGGDDSTGGLSRREIMARAAERRAQAAQKRKPAKNSGGSGSEASAADDHEGGKR